MRKSHGSTTLGFSRCLFCDLRLRCSHHDGRSADGSKSALESESIGLSVGTTEPSFRGVDRRPSILKDALVLSDAQRVRTPSGKELPIKLVPKLPTNRPYANGATAAYFNGREVRMRGALENANGKEAFVARTIWPSDFAFEPAKLETRPLRNPSELAAYVRQPIKQTRGIETRLLWERHPGQARDWKQKPVLGFILNGAQGDDDESLGGHFAIATGRIGDKGEWSDWAVNNFYNLDSFSEKGAIAATLPMDDYLMDLNSSQQYYRASYMLVAVLNHQRTAAAFQSGVQRVFNHFYRHDFQYRRASANCAGISMDVFESLGWTIPKRGPTAPLNSLAAYAYVAAKDASLQSGRKIYDYLNEEQTRLLPAVAFEAAGLDLLQLVGTFGGAARPFTSYESVSGTTSRPSSWSAFRKYRRAAPWARPRCSHSTSSAHGCRKTRPTGRSYRSKRGLSPQPCVMPRARLRKGLPRSRCRLPVWAPVGCWERCSYGGARKNWQPSSSRRLLRPRNWCTEGKCARISLPLSNSGRSGPGTSSARLASFGCSSPRTTRQTVCGPRPIMPLSCVASNRSARRRPATCVMRSR